MRDPGGCARPAAKGGLQQGDLILEIGREPVPSLEDYNRLMKKHQDKDEILLLVKQGKATHWMVLKKEDK